jgi:endonuclease/exonuclease/phosphatase family metal-dependent hydrolase
VPLGAVGDVVLGGDFNVAAGYRGTDDVVRMSRGERDLLDRMTNEFGLIACWQSLHPGAPLAQTLRWSANRSAPYHCDGIFVPRKWLRKLETCDVLTDDEWTRLSDHNPVVVKMRRGRALVSQ